MIDAPFTNVGDTFYERSLNCYNFVINEKSKMKAHCYSGKDFMETEGPMK